MALQVSHKLQAEASKRCQGLARGLNSTRVESRRVEKDFHWYIVAQGSLAFSFSHWHFVFISWTG